MEAAQQSVGMNRKKVLVVFGTRPEAIKLAPVIRELRLRPERFETVSCSTGQHREMLRHTLKVFDLEPDYDLDLMEPGQSLAQVTTSALNGLENVLRSARPDLVLVQGDTTTTFAASLASYYRRVPVGHVEAGLRTENKYSPFPEEINRRLTTHLADYHFAPTDVARDRLLAEGVCPDRIVVTGNTVIDALRFIRARLSENPSLASSPPELRCLNGQRLILVTAHRRESFGGPLQQICEAIRALAERYSDVHVVYPVHLNPNVQGPVRQLLGGLPNVKLLAPMDYISFIALMDRSTLLLTDSGGIQEEGPSLGKPVLVMRNVSERPEGILAGAACLVGTDPQRIFDAVARLLDDHAAYESMVCGSDVYGDGKASQRIAEYLTQCLG
jgi:UDP-N-acetylglucosamine 2-epimerase (non-hydrolysing)